MAMTESTQTTKKPITVRLLMWDISSSLADRVFALSNLILVVGAALVLIGTIGAVVLSGVREQFSNERISANEKSTVEAIAETEIAKKGAAEANARAAEANLELARMKAPRILTAEQQQRLITKINSWAGQSASFNVVGEQEAVTLMQLIRGNLASAGWTLAPSQMGDIEIDGAGVAYGTGVEIQVAPSVARGTKAAGAANALAQALLVEGIAAAATVNPQLKNTDAINVLVGKKP
jgi:hypothetical protein